MNWLPLVIVLINVIIIFAIELDKTRYMLFAREEELARSRHLCNQFQEKSIKLEQALKRAEKRV